MITEQAIINNKQINVTVTLDVKRIDIRIAYVLHEIPSSKFKYLQV